MTAIIPMFAAALGLGLFAAGCAATTPERQAALPATRPTDMPGLPNFGKVDNALFRGGQPTAEGFKALRAMGIRTVVNLRASHDDTELMRGLDMQYASIPMRAWTVNPRQVARVLNIIRDPANQPVFIHCEHGADRTGTVVAFYRVTCEQCERERAVAELFVFGHHWIWFNLPRLVRRFDAQDFTRDLAEAPPATMLMVP